MADAASLVNKAFVRLVIRVLTFGGGIYNDNGTITITITRSTISGNQSQGRTYTGGQALESLRVGFVSPIKRVFNHVKCRANIPPQL